MNDTNCYVMEFTLAFGLLLVLVKDTTSGQQLDCACYGNDVTIDSVMPNCTSSNGIIIIDSVFRAAKLQSTGCPAVANSTTRDEANCCSYDNGTDCRIDLTPSEVPTVFAECAGTATCSQQVTWQSTSSSQCMGTHMNETNYMCINYTCIPEADVLEFCNSSATEITATTSYFINDGYPSNISHSNCCACVVTASAASATIDLDILDLQLYEANSTCFQTVFVRDNSSVTTYNCTDNINYTIRNLLTSNGSTLTVTLKSGAAAQGNGKAWFRATVSNGGMTTTCNSVSVCPDEITTSTSSTPATTTGGTNSVTSGTGTTNNKSNEEAWLFGLSVTVSIMCIAGLFVILLLLFLLFCVLCYTWGKSKSFRVAEDRSDSTLGLYSDKSNSSPESFNPYTIFVRENSTRTGIQSVRTADVDVSKHLRNHGMPSTVSQRNGVFVYRPFDNRFTLRSFTRRHSLVRIESP